jgi:hypothetical protein
MRLTTAVGISTLFLSSCEASKHGLSHLDTLHRRHHHNHKHLQSPRAEETGEALDIFEKRGTQCAFPTAAGLVAVTPNALNAGWAMSPDQACTPGNYCPYACPAGQVSLQWNPLATSYTYPLSMDGGLYCNSNGVIEKPFPNKDYCADGTGTLAVKNQAANSVAFCQTVLPGKRKYHQWGYILMRCCAVVL